MADWNTTTLPIARMHGVYADDTITSEFEGDAEQTRQRNPVRMRQIVIDPKPNMSKAELTAYKSFFATYGTASYFSITLIDDATDYNVRFTQGLDYRQTNIYPEYYEIQPITLKVKGAA